MRVGKVGSFSIKVERKLFMFKFQENGSKVEVVDVRKSKSSRVILSVGVATWLKDCLSSLIKGTHLDSSFLKRWRAPDALWGVQKSPIKEVFAVLLRCVVAMESFKAGRSLLFILEGRAVMGGFPLEKV